MAQSTQAKNNSVVWGILSSLRSPEAKFKLNCTKGVPSAKFFIEEKSSPSTETHRTE